MRQKHRELESPQLAVAAAAELGNGEAGVSKWVCSIADTCRFGGKVGSLRALRRSGPEIERLLTMSVTGVETRSDFYPVPDGLLEIEHELPAILDVIARTARWVHPDTFKALPIWCPYTARGRPLYDAAWSVALKSGKGVAKVEQNIRAAAALRDALGVKSSSKPKNWTVCHIWGYDDDKFAGKSNVVQDPKYYSCIGNMVWLPTPLKGFTDAVPHIKECLRVCAYYLYGWVCKHPSVQDSASKVLTREIPNGYPQSWPTADRRILPCGTAPFNARVQVAIAKRKARIQEQLDNLELEHYPRDEVRAVLEFWKVSL